MRTEKAVAASLRLRREEGERDKLCEDVFVTKISNKLFNYSLNLFSMDQLLGLWSYLASASSSRSRRPLKSFSKSTGSSSGPRWVRDKAAYWCKNCQTDFSFVVRKVCSHGVAKL